MPYIVRVASGELEQLSIFGNDYNTPDGTGVRDYIHVVDLAKGHIKALEKLEKENSGIYIYNLGTGVGYSVLDMVKAFEESTGKKVNYKIVERRAGDIATCYSDPQKAKNELHWEATKTLNDMCKDSWKYIQNMLGLLNINYNNLPYLTSYYVGSIEVIAFIVGVICCTPIFKNMIYLRNKYVKVFVNIWLIILFVISVSAIASGTYNPFIYFRF